MKVQVKDKQGIDQAGNKHPAPGIEDGTYECELKDQWQNPYTHDKRWEDEPSEAHHQHSLSHGYNTRQAWEVLAEQEKEGYKTIDQIAENEYPLIQSNIYSNNVEATNMRILEIRDAFKQGAEFQSTRIAELSARVVELEGVTHLGKVDDIEQIASRVHDAWWKEKKANGFHAPKDCESDNRKTYDKSDWKAQDRFDDCFDKNTYKWCDKCHPDMYPYKKLSENAKEYDRATVRTVLSAMKYNPTRVAQLEGVLREIIDCVGTSTQANKLATNALKNQQP